MEYIRDYCKGEGCGKLTAIVNKKYFLCDECNYKRLHGGKSKQDVYADRAKQRGAGVPRVSQKPVRTIDELVGDTSFKLTRASKIKQISGQKKFRCSDGTMVSQVDIKRKLAETYDKIKQKRPPVCQGSGRSDVPLSFSHTISQADCKALGKTELIWDERNIELEGFEAPTSRPTMAHNIWEVGAIEQKIQLLNFERKLEFIAEHDPEGYRKIMAQLDELEQKLQQQ